MILKRSALIHKGSTRLPLNCMLTPSLRLHAHSELRRTLEKTKCSQGLGLGQGAATLQILTMHLLCWWRSPLLGLTVTALFFSYFHSCCQTCVVSAFVLRWTRKIICLISCQNLVTAAAILWARVGTHRAAMSHPYQPTLHHSHMVNKLSSWQSAQIRNPKLAHLGM